MSGPLKDITVIDLSAVVSGPFCTQILADQGANVIKIEPLGLGDASRGTPFRVGDISSLFASCNRGKRSIALDLKDAKSVAMVKELVKGADVLVENFRPGVCKKMGLGPQDMLQLNPDLIYTSITGFGSTGPYSSDRAYDPIIQALSGVIAIQKNPQGGDSDIVRTVLADKATSLHAAQAISAALYAREKGTARGQHLEISLLLATLYFLWPDVFASVSITHEDIVRGPALYEMVRVRKVADGCIVLFAQSDSEYQGLLKSINRIEWWDEPEVSDRMLRFQPANHALLQQRIDDVVINMNGSELVLELRKNGVPAAAMLTVEEVLRNEHVMSEGYIRDSKHPTIGSFRYADFPVKFSTTECTMPSTIESLGESTEEILSSFK